MFKSLITIIVCYHLGALLSFLIGGYISPAVAGMLILFLTLQFKLLKVSNIKPFATFLLDNLLLFFIPITTGVALISFASIKGNLISIILASTISTFIVLWVVSATLKKKS